MAVDLKNHPGLNPTYFDDMAERQSIMVENRRRRSGLIKQPPLKVPPQPNKYVPHIGAKQRAKGAARSN